jgi:hypothetical protein
MVWKSLLVAALLTPPVAYVAGVLAAGAEPVERRPALVLQRDGAEPPGIEPRPTLAPSPGGPATTGPDPEEDDPDDVDDPDDADDADDADDDLDDVEVVRPGARDLDDEEDDDADD